MKQKSMKYTKRFTKRRKQKCKKIMQRIVPAKNALAIFVDVPLIGESILYKNKGLSKIA